MADEEGRDGNDIIPGDVFVIGGGDDTRVSVTECNFSVLRDDGLAYADKSRFVDRVLSNPARVLLITRPRRFGKSLNLSMLRYFLDLRYRGNHWFDGLEIDTHQEYDDVRNAVPVVYIDLKDVRGMTSSENQRAFEKMIMHTVNGFRYLLDSDRLDDFMRGEIDRVINLRLPDLDDLSLLVECLHAHHGVRPVLLIDEYEAPVLFAMDRGYFSDAMDRLRTVLSSLLKNNEHLGKAVITGVLQMAKEGMFSGVNNLYVSSVFSDDEFSDCFGLTEAEVSGLCEKAGCPERLDEIRAHYDGYRFGDTEVYSPYSVICYFQYSMRPDSYWVASGSDEQIGRMLNVADRHVRAQLAVLLSGGTVDARIDSRLSFPRSGDVLEMDPEDVPAYIVQAGYLTATRNPDGTYALRVPNREVMDLFGRKVRRWFTPRGWDHMNAFTSAVLSGDAKAVREEIEKVLEVSFNPRSESLESAPHMFIAGMMWTQSTHRVKVELHSGDGIADIGLVPWDRSGMGAIVEIKKISERDDADEMAGKALAQVREKEYAWFARGSEVLSYGIAVGGGRVAVRMAEGD